MTELILLRHGETVGQSSIRLYGATDIALSPVGEQQAARAAAALRTHSFSRIVSSPLQRARKTAEIVHSVQTSRPFGPEQTSRPSGPEQTSRPSGPEQTAPVALVVLHDLREVDFGAWEGLTWAEVAERDPDNHRLWQQTRPHFNYPGGEARPDFLRRIHAAAREIPQDPGPTLAVLHKGVIKAVIAALTGMSYEEATHLPVPLGSLHHLERTGDTWQLITVGRTDHLGDLYIPD